MQLEKWSQSIAKYEIDVFCSQTAFDSSSYETTSIASAVSLFLDPARRIQYGAVAHETITLVTVMRQYVSANSSLFGEQVSQVGLARRFGYAIDEHGNRTPNVSTKRLSMAKNLASCGLVSDVMTEADNPIGALIAYLQQRSKCGRGVSIETLYNEICNADMQRWTLSQAVTTLIAKALKEGLDLSNVLQEVSLQTEGYDAERKLHRSQGIVNRSKLLLFSITRCAYCGNEGNATTGPDGKSWHMDHVTPLSRDGEDCISNMVKACATCNLSKGRKIQNPLDGTPTAAAMLHRSLTLVES